MNFTHLSAAPYAGASTAEKMAYLERCIAKCQKCPDIAASRTHTVPGDGPRQRGRIFVVGEAPGSVEDRTGVPFVGPAGRMLDQALRLCGVLRQDVYVANCLKCRPTPPLGGGNRAPSKVELEDCLPYLYAQIEILDPKVILALGSHAASAFGIDDHMANIRGKSLKYKEWTVIPTWHPAYVLRETRANSLREFQADVQAAVWKAQA